jgi:Immunoglobulin domain/PKD domain
MKMHGFGQFWRSVPSLVLAAVLQGLPLLRTSGVLISTAQPWVAVVRWAAATAAALASLDAVSGATGLTINNAKTTTATGTNGLALGFRVAISSPVYGVPQAYSASGLPPGLKISTVGAVSGIPTASGVFPVEVSGWQHSPAGNLGDLNASPPHVANINIVVTIIDIAPSIVTPPGDQSAPVGGTAAFTVAASGAELAYQWLHGDLEIPGATNSTLTIKPVTADSAGKYSVRVTNSGGIALSAAATLTVSTPVTVTVSPALPISPYPLHQGELLTLTAVVSGATANAYTWTKGGLAVGSAASLTIGPVTSLDSGAYLVTAGTSAGAVTSAPVQITVSWPLTLGNLRLGTALQADAATLPGRSYAWGSSGQAGSNPFTFGAPFTASAAVTTLNLPLSPSNGLFRIRALDPK